MNFDLEINNYKIDELRDMFELPENYDKNMINNKESKLIENIIRNKNINEDTKSKTITFLIKAKNILSEHISRNNNNKNESSLIINRGEKQNELKKNTPYKAEHTSNTLPKTELLSYDDHMVQVRSSDGYPPDPAFTKGILNPLKKRVISRTVTIDSRFRENYYNSSAGNFTVQLPMILENVLTMSLSSIEMPTSYYVISDQYQNNFFSITVNDVTKIISISSGNYTTASLILYLNNEMLTFGGDFKYVVFAVNVSAAFGGSGQMMVGVDLAKPDNIIINNIELNFQADKFGNDDRSTPLPLKFGWILGFRNGIYTGNLNYVSEAITDISGPRYFYLVVEDFNNNNNNALFYTAFNSSLLNKSVLGRFPLNTSLYSLLLQNNLNVVVVKREYFGPVDIHNLKIQLLDEFGRIVDLNYMDFSFSLFFTIAYDI
jgi:hypothetical protein